MNRRACLAAVGTAGVAASSGCLGGSDGDRTELPVRRSAVDPDADCAEQELLDFERVFLAPRLAGLLGVQTATGWEVDLRAGEELYVRVTNPDADHLPRLRIADPAGSALVDGPPVDNIYTVQPERDGRYAVTVHNRRLSDTGEWFVDLVWYSAPDCRR